MPVTPAKVERVTPDDAEISDFNILRNTLGLQHAFTRPLVHTLRTRTGTPQFSRTKKATPIVAPRDAQREIVFLLDLSWLNRRSAPFYPFGSLLLGKLESNIRAGTQSHQTEQSCTKLRHRQVVVNR